METLGQPQDTSPPRVLAREQPSLLQWCSWPFQICPPNSRARGDSSHVIPPSRLTTEHHQIQPLYHFQAYSQLLACSISTQSLTFT